MYCNTRKHALSLNNPLKLMDRLDTAINPELILKMLLRGLACGHQDEQKETLGMLEQYVQRIPPQDIQEGYLHSLSAQLILYSL